VPQTQANLPPQAEEAINELVSISGRSRDDCIQALRLAYGDPNRAFEYLMSGAPLTGAGAGAEGGEDDYGDEDPSSYAGAGAGAGAGGAGGAGNNPFAALASNPNFAMIRQRILQDPSFYQQFMATL
jgi:UV excision repair protein RAD23